MHSVRSAFDSRGARAAIVLLEDLHRQTDVPWEQQIKSCTAVIESRAENPERLAVAYNNRGVARLELSAGSTVMPDAAAMADFGEAIRLNPKYADAYFNRGRLWHVNGVFHNAIDLYSYAIELDPTHAQAFRHRALARLYMDELDEAITDFTEAIRLGLNDASVYRERGQARSIKKDYDGAIADFTEAIRLDPRLTGAYADRGAAWLAKNELDKAAIDYGEAIRLDPHNADYLLNRGYIHFFRADFRTSAADLDQAPVEKHSYQFATRVLFRYLARSHAGEDARAQLEADQTYHSTDVFELFLGSASLEEALKSARSSREVCEMAFYAGEWHVLRGDRAAARPHLQAAAEPKCSEQMPHHRAAASELKRLDK